MNIRAKHLIFLIALSSVSVEATAETVTFQSLATEVLGKSPSLKISNLDVEQLRTSQSAANWALGPSLSLGSARVFRRAENEMQGAETSTSISARLNLFDGLASLKRLDIADVALGKAEIEIQEERRKILATLADSYLAWQRAHQKLSIVTQLSTMRETMLENIERTVRRGERSQTDQLLFQNLLLQAQERASRTEIEQRQAMISIQKSLSEVRGKTQLNQIPQTSAVFTRDYCDQEASFAQHPRVQMLQRDSTLYALQRDAAASGFFPTIDLSLEKDVDFFSTASTNNQETVRLAFNWPLFTGLSTRFERQELGYEIQKAELRKSEAQTELVLTHQENCARLRAVDEWYQKAGSIAKNYTELLKTSRVQYENGGISTLGLTDQELRQLDAELSLIDARFARQEVLASQWVLHDGNLDSVGKK